MDNPVTIKYIGTQMTVDFTALLNLRVSPQEKEDVKKVIETI